MGCRFSYMELPEAEILDRDSIFVIRYSLFDIRFKK